MDPIELPEGFKADDVPAWVLHAGDGKRTLCWHPCGLQHPNAAATIARLRGRGYDVINAPDRQAA